MNPSPSSSAVVVRVSLACRLQRRGVRSLRTTTRITGKPSEPTSTASPIGMEKKGSPRYWAVPTASGTKPALLNALIA